MLLADDLDDGVPGLTSDHEVTDLLLADTLARARLVGGVGRVLLFHPAQAEGRLAARALGFRLWPAEGSSPGQRYANAFRQAAELGYEAALVMGLSAPTLAPERVTEAAAMLEQNQGVVIADGHGGVALLGLQRDEPTLFAGDDDLPRLEVLRTRARQQLVRMVELEPHRGLDPESLPGYLASRS